MGKKKPKGPKPSGPKGPKKPYRTIPLALVLLGALACGGDDSSEAEEAATCAALAGLATEHLFSIGCGLEDADLAADFAIACFLGSPTREEAVACLTDLYSLEECPADLPVSCVSFAELLAGVADTVINESPLELNGWPIYTFPGENGSADAVSGASGQGLI